MGNEVSAYDDDISVESDEITDDDGSYTRPESKPQQILHCSVIFHFHKIEELFNRLPADHYTLPTSELYNIDYGDIVFSQAMEIRPDHSDSTIDGDDAVYSEMKNRLRLEYPFATFILESGNAVKFNDLFEELATTDVPSMSSYASEAVYTPPKIRFSRNNMVARAAF